jgi:hypothetical protein
MLHFISFLPVKFALRQGATGIQKKDITLDNTLLPVLCFVSGLHYLIV